MDVTSEVGARGGSVVTPRSGGLNSLPSVNWSWPLPKHGVLKSHLNNGLKGCCVVVVVVVVVVLS
jgi:hypothetical protein